VRPSARGRALRAGVATALLAAALLTGCAPQGTTAGSPVDTPAAAPTPTVAPATPTEATSPARRGPAPLPEAAEVAVKRVTIDSIGVRTTKLEKLTTDRHGVLEAPKDPDRAGWYADGTVPGQTGPAVIAGHVDSTTGPAVFYDLRKVGEGDRITVELTDGTSTTFVADRVVTTPKDGFPTDEVFGPTPDAELRLITCGGPYDRTVGSYVDNTVVFATATS